MHEACIEADMLEIDSLAKRFSNAEHPDILGDPRTTILAALMLDQVQGHIVEFPLQFLEGENLSSHFGEKEYLLSQNVFT